MREESGLYVALKDIREVVERWFGNYAVVTMDGDHLVMVERNEDGDVDRLRVWTAGEIADTVGDLPKWER